MLNFNSLKKGILSGYLRCFSTTSDAPVSTYKHVLNDRSIHKKIIDARYAVRGIISNRASEITREMEKGIKFPFEELIEANIGNPQACGQKPFTFNREVLSCMLNTNLLNSNDITHDAKERAKSYLSQIKHQAVGKNIF
jgi:alanine transaminase